MSSSLPVYFGRRAQPEFFVLVDEAQLDLLSLFRWHPSSQLLNIRTTLRGQSITLRQLVWLLTWRESTAREAILLWLDKHDESVLLSLARSELSPLFFANGNARDYRSENIRTSEQIKAQYSRHSVVLSEQEDLPGSFGEADELSSYAEENRKDEDSLSRSSLPPLINPEKQG